MYIVCVLPLFPIMFVWRVEYIYIAQSAGAVEYTHCFSAEG